MNKVIFVDRDGTVIVEPEDEKIDNLAKLDFLPYAISALKYLSLQGYPLVMVTNQDGLGTPSFPETDFWPAHEKMLSTLVNEGVTLAHVFIDRSFESEHSNQRKPHTGMVDAYIKAHGIDLEHSFMIGDRDTDVQFAKNLGCKSILLVAPGAAPFHPHHLPADYTCGGWQDVVKVFKTSRQRTVTMHRKTSETRIELSLNLDGEGKYEIHTGIPFYDHMLSQLARHSGADIALRVEGDLDVDEHHTIEDSAIALGQAFKEALGDKWGIERYGFLLPMDETLVQCALDLSGRPEMVFHGTFDREYVGGFPTEMLPHWMKSFAFNAGITLHVSILEGENTHHKVEACFKALARCLKQAMATSGSGLPTTKGLL